MKKILVTGGAGYIGSHAVVELVNAGFSPVIVDNMSRTDQRLLEGIEKITGAKPVFEKGDCNDYLFLDKVFSQHGAFDAVVHFAAYKAVGESVAEPLMYHQNNVGGMLQLLEAMKKHGVRDLIFSSSCTVYGQPDFIPVDESAPMKKAESPYGATKQICERILEDVARTDFRVISLRYFNPIGAHPSSLIGELPVGVPNNLVPFITQTAAGVRDKLRVFGGDYNTADGSCIRDFIHVVDLAKAHVKAIDYLMSVGDRNVYDVFNLGTGQGVSVLQLINSFQKVTGLKLNYEVVGRRPGDVEKVYGDPTKAEKVLNWRTELSLDDSLMHAWNWEKKIRGIK